MLLVAYFRCVAGRALKGAEAYGLNDRVICRNDTFGANKIAALGLQTELRDLTRMIKEHRGSTKHLEMTGGVYTQAFQCHVYNRILSNLVRARQAAGHATTVVCETGFNGGHSALLFLLSHPSVHYYGWELADPFGREASGARTVWASKYASSRLAERFPGRLHVTFGDSHKDIVPFFATRPNLECDIVSVDGDHSYAGVVKDLAQLEPHLRAGGFIFADDCNAQQRGHRSKGQRSPAAMFEAYAQYVTARNASLTSLLRVENCAGQAGFCIATKGSISNGVPGRAPAWMQHLPEH